jgi:hypothetical protein
MMQAAGVLVAATMALLGYAVDATSAHADAFGELGKVGEFGKGAGQFHWPIDLAVDPDEGNSVFVVDSPEGTFPGPEPAHVRVQEFASGLGAPVASVLVPVPEEQYVSNIAVDPALHRLYVLKRKQTTGLSKSEDDFVASEIDIYSTVPTPGKTLALEEVEGDHGDFYTFPATPPNQPPPSGALRDPQGLAVEPGSHDLLVLGIDEEGDAVVQRIVATGASLGGGKLESGEFDDTAQQVSVHENSVGGIAAGPNGIIYLGGNDVLFPPNSELLPAVVKLETASPSHSLANPSISLVHKQEAGESPPLTGGNSGASDTNKSVGEQLAISPDGTVIYAPAMSKKETLEQSPGNYEVRGISTATGQQQIVFGGGPNGTDGTCNIESEDYAIAAGSGGVVYVLDEAWALGEEEPYPYGFHLIEFGPNGSGCPAPATSFTVGGAGGGSAVEVQKGAKIKLEASSAELRGAEPTELTWEITGPSGPESATKAEKTAGLILEHSFLQPGSYMVTLNMAVTKSGYGPPPPVTREVKVIAPPPTASFEVFPSGSLGEPLRVGQTIKPEEAVTFNGAESVDPTGSLTGTKTHTLKSYTWAFGDGMTEQTSTPEYTRTFANHSSQARVETVTLTVTNEEGVESAPSIAELTIQGVNSEPVKEPAKEATKEPAKEPVPSKTSTLTPPVQSKPLTNAQRLAAALRGCRKLKTKRKRATCEKAAKRRYAPKPKKKHRRR